MLRKETMSEHAIVSWAHEEIAGSDLGDEKILVDFRQGRYYGLNPTGTFLFSMLEEPVPVHVLIEAVAERYKIGRQSAASDVSAFLEAMSEHNLITIEDASAVS
jgi:hypothetical protein